MKRILAAVLMCGAGSCIAANATAVKKSAPPSAAPPSAAAAAKAKAARAEQAAAVEFASMAPADEYFGPLKLSIIGISNTIRDVGLRYTYNHDLASQSLASAQLTESAVRDWLRRYPHDPQLPRNVYFLQRLYTKILLQRSRDRASIVAKLLFADFPSSPQARQLKKTLALEHLSPLPSPTPTPDPSATPEPTPTAVPTGVPAAGSASFAPDSAAMHVESAPGSATTLPSGAIVATPLVSASPVGSASPVISASPVVTTTPAASRTPLPSPAATVMTTTTPAPVPSPTSIVPPSGTPTSAPTATATASPH